MEILFSQNMNFISPKRKKTHQGNLDQETEAVFDVRLAPSANRTSLRKNSGKGKLLIAQSPASPENCKKATNGSRRQKKRQK